MDQPTINQLFRDWQRGSQSAGAIICRRFRPELARYFRRRVRRDIDDLIQETLTGLVRGVANFRGDCSVRTYVYTIARRVLHHDRGRLHTRPMPQLHETHLLASEGGSACDKLSETETESMLASAMGTLPQKVALALRAYYWEGRTARDIAFSLGEPEGTVRDRLRRGKRQLRAHDGLRDVAPF